MSVSNDHSAKVTHYSKKKASRKVRKIKDLGKGNSYKKITNSYDISDFSIRFDWEGYLIREEDIVGRKLTKEERKELKNTWEHYYKRK